jgi:hypothetical protein
MNRAAAGKKKPNSGRLPLWGLFVILAGFVLSQALQAAAEQGQAPAAPPNEIAVALKETPVWEVTNPRVRDSFLRGHYVPLQKEKLPQVKYPEFASGVPLYGEAQFEEGSRPRRFRLALACSQPGGDYDLLYFDDNADGDLTNDKPRRPVKETTARLARRMSPIKETYFESVNVPFDFGPGDQQAVEVLPCVTSYPGGRPQFSFVAAHVHVGEFHVDRVYCDVFLGCQYTIQGRLDQPSTALILVPYGGEPASWWYGNRLNALHLLGSRYYRFSCTPAGNKLWVRPYEGALGVFEVSPGGRKVEKLTVCGSLSSKDSAVAVGGDLERGQPTPARQCRIPVGDYYPVLVDVEMADLRLTISNNYNTSAQGQPRGREPLCGITIRADKPYVLDFSNKPVVLFEQPKAEVRAHPGDEVKISALLVDPVLDIVIRGLIDTTRTRTQILRAADGKEFALPNRPWSFDPNVVIRRATGEIVAEGVMPFG